MIEENKVLSFLETLYAAAWGRADWQAAMGSLGVLFHASRVCRFNAFADGGAVTAIHDVTASVDDPDIDASGLVKALSQERKPQHPYLSFFAGHVPAVARLDQIVDLDGFRRGPVWHELMKPRDIDHDIRAVMEVNPILETRSSICIHRAMGRSGAAEPMLRENNSHVPARVTLIN